MRNILIAVGVLGLVALGCSKKSQSGGADATTDEGGGQRSWHQSLAESPDS
jgi:hypothetical protein